MNLSFTWLGQAGLLVKSKTLTLLIDPYLSDSVAKVNPKNARRFPVDESFLSLKPDAILITHDHLDHLDPETLVHYLGDKPVTVLAPEKAWTHVRETFGGPHNYVMLNRGSVWTLSDGLTVYAVRAEHSDLTAVGFILDDGEHTYYVTGDTLYNYNVIDDVLALLPDGPDVIFLPVNGVGNNMNMLDAADLVTDVGARYAVPLHFGLFDSLDPNTFECDNKIIPTAFKEIPLNL